MTTNDKPAYALFVRDLYKALRHLYDPAALRSSPLLDLFSLGQRQDPKSALQSLLLAAIEALKPPATVPPQANAWRIYHILNQRYAGQFTQHDIAASLALSPRQLRRLQADALQALADHLWAHYELADRLSTAPSDPRPAAPITVGAMPTRQQELEWLKQSGPEEVVDVHRALEAALSTVRPLARTLAVTMRVPAPHALPPIAMQLTVARHALLNVLLAAVSCASRGVVEIATEGDRAQVRVRIRPLPGPGCAQHGLDAKHTESLEMARQLVELYGGSLELISTPGGQAPFAASLMLRAAAQISVLVVDDNVDTLRLLEQYLVGSRYRFVGIHDPAQTVASALESGAQIVVLDLMLPGTDGWEVLGQLREHPRLRQVPVIICTILPQEDLALAQGAATLVRKPVSRAVFLAALDRQIGLPSPESR